MLPCSKVGDEVIVGTTGDDATETEWATIWALRYIPGGGGQWDTEISITNPLRYKHLAVTETHGSHTFDMRSEVGLYLRAKTATGDPSIAIQGVDAHTNWDFRFKSMAKSLLGLLFVVESGGSATLRGVRFEDGGTYKPSLVAIREGRKVVPMVRCLRGSACDIRNSVMIPRRGHAVEAFSGYFSNNVLWQSFVGFRVGGSATVVHNAIYGSKPDPFASADPGDLAESDSGIQAVDCGWSLTLIGNAVSGAGGPCMGFMGFCVKEANFANNTLHAGELGFAVKGSVSSRPDKRYGVIRDMTIWRIRNIAVWGYSTSIAPVVQGVRVADAAVGFFWGNIGGDPEKHIAYLQRISILDSAFVGRSNSAPSCYAQVGILLPIFASQGYSISPGVCGPLGGHWTRGIYGMEHPTGSNPAIAGEVRVTGTTFLRYTSTPLAATSCGSSTVLMTTMRGGMESSDAVPPHFFSGITIDAISRTNLAKLPEPKREWIVPNKCVVMDCDGPKHVILHDLDGTLTGLGPDASVTARSEFMNEVRFDTTKYTWYNIPTKMLYDPAPLNDRGDPGWDMSAYAAYTGGGQTFSYRRLEDRDDTSTTVVLGTVADGTGEEKGAGEAGVATSTGALDVQTAVGIDVEGRQLASAADADWRNRMVFYPGDERSFYQGLDGRTCEPTSAIFDPSCRTVRKTHREVAYRGYGHYRKDCTLNTHYNAWVCPASSMIPARLIVESMDEDHTSRSLAPVALASGGYVDLVGGGWDHQRPKDCGGYDCLKRLMTFHTIVGVNRSYDLAFTGTNPKHLRLMLPSGGGEPTPAEQLRSRVLVSIFYSNPQKLEVHLNKRIIQPLEHFMPASKYARILH